MKEYIKNILQNKIFKYLVVAIIFIFLLFLYYYEIFYFNYPVPPGDDCVRHMTEASSIINTGFYGKSEVNSADPPLFHILLSSITLITGENIVSVTKYFMPLLTILSVFTIYFIVRRYFNTKLALLSLIIYTLISPQPYYIYNDGTYLNIISAEYFLIFVMAFFPIILKQKNKFNWTNVFLMTVFILAEFLSHSLSAIYLIMIMFVICLYYLYDKLIKKKAINKNIVAIYGIVGISSIFLTWQFYLWMTIEKILKYVGFIKGKTGNILDALPSSFTQVTTWGAYKWHFGYIAIVLAVGGLFYLLIKIKNKKIEKYLILVWMGTLFFGSRSSFFQLPTRFARDMAIPVFILVSIFIYYFIKIICERYGRNKFLRSIIYIIPFIFIFTFGIQKVNGITKYNYRIRVQDTDVEAMDWIKANTDRDDTILGAPKTITNGSWGSHIELITGRKTLDGMRCIPKEEDDMCDVLYTPMSEKSVKYYRENSIDYVYAGKKILGSYVTKDRIKWNYQEKLEETLFLEKVAEFSKSSTSTKVIIFKVNEELLNSL